MVPSQIILSLPSNGLGSGVNSVIRLPAGAVTAATADAATSGSTSRTAIPPRRRSQDSAPILVEPPVFSFTTKSSERAPVTAYSSPYLAQMLAQALPGDPDSIALFFDEDSTILNRQVMQLFGQIKYMPSNAGQAALAQLAVKAARLSDRLPSNDNAVPVSLPVKPPSARPKTLSRQSGIAAYQGAADRLRDLS